MKQAFIRILGAKQLLRAMGSQSASVYANQVISFVIPWLVLTRTGSAASAGIVAFAMGAAAFSGTLIGGLVTDRIGGRKVSIIADTLSILTALALAAALFVDFFALWFVVVTQVLGVFFDGPGMIAKNTTIPAAATDAKVPMVRAMGLQQTLQNVAMFVGPVSAGVLIAWLTESITLAIASVLFLAAIYLVARLPKKVLVHEHPMSIRQAYRDMKEAVVFIVKEPFLGPMQLFGPLYAFVIAPVSAIVFPAWYVFNQQSSGSLGLFLGAIAIGGMVGGFIFAAFAPKVSQRTWLATSTVGYALTLFVISLLQPGSIWAVIAGFIMGVIFTGIMAIPYTAFYVRTPQHLLGRVNSLGWATGSFVTAIAGLFFGWLVSATSATVGIVACAIIMMVMAIGVLVLPFMKRLDEASAPQQ